MTIFSFRHMSRDELDFHVRCADHRPIPEIGPQVDLPPTAAEEARYVAQQERRAARTARVARTVPTNTVESLVSEATVAPAHGGPTPGSSEALARRNRPVRWFRRVVLERGRGRSSSVEGVEVGAI